MKYALAIRIERETEHSIHIYSFIHILPKDVPLSRPQLAEQQSWAQIILRGYVVWQVIAVLYVCLKYLFDACQEKKKRLIAYSVN